MSAVGTVEGLEVWFGPRRAVAVPRLELQPGELLVLVGRSGSGKTTLLRSFNRLNECFPGCQTKGSVRLRFGGGWCPLYDPGIPVTDLRRRVGMVFQTPNVLPTTIERNLALPLRQVLGVPKAEVSGRLAQALAEAGLWDEVKDRLSAPALSLSGGQQQRLCLARALVLEPEYLLLDEPTAALDFRAAGRVEDLLLKLKARHTMIAVSHSLGQARRLADRVAVFREGELARVLRREEIDDRAAFAAALEEAF